ncbi:MAG: preprotein translocase subunit SecA [Clostridiales bacterium]|nr:preprotein translocase subunit SecA [Clostridiales bacterium]
MGLFNRDSKSLKKLKKIADQVVALDEKYAAMTDEELKSQTDILKQRIANGETLDQILPDAYAVVREAAFRVLNMKHFYVQILGGIALHQGRIAEMATGEGKTLVATLPAYLNALAGKGVHIVTVNEYLAKRDAAQMGKVHRFLGLTVGVSVSGMDPNAKRDAYNCDITYATNNELGFDYLRDNMVNQAAQRMQRGHFFAIVDEVDSILIDEARTPLIISGKGVKSSDAYYTAQKFAKTLTPEEDFEIDKKTKAIHLTEEGTIKAEKYYRIESLSDVKHMELNHHILNALKANYIMVADENYIVKDDEILIVDEFTGRLMQGRRFSDGLHQAIEAKEGVKIKDENKTLATITFQNYFRLYKKLSGMTGTAKTEETEFNGIYRLDVIKIPTNKPCVRVDEPDIVYRSEKGKIAAIVEEIKERNAKGQPVLVGTVNIDKSEEFSKALTRAGIKHTVLNAKNHEKESEIVAQAGRLGAVTIATNMAGRGTDILLGGNPEFMAVKKMENEKFEPEEISFATSFNSSDDEKLNHAREVYNKYYKEFKAITDEEKQKVIEAGGLHIVGTERHESRRIDNQLRGRAGRQGDVGSSVFFLSLEDDLIVRFAGTKLQTIADVLKIDDSMPIQMRIMSRQIETAQKRIEAQHYGSRKTVLRFDDVMNTQREIIYGERNKVLDGVDIHDQILQMIPAVIGRICDEQVDADKPSYEWDYNAINNGLEDKLFPKGTNLVNEKYVEDLDAIEFKEKLIKHVTERYQALCDKTKEFGFDFSNIERFMLLRVVDSLWMDHIDEMSILRNEIIVQQYGQRDPVTMYKQEGFEMFDRMVERIQEDTVAFLLNSKIEIKMPKEMAEKMVKEHPELADKYKAAEVVNHTPRTVQKEQGRNELCACGSGKKYKDCCGKKN